MPEPLRRSPLCRRYPRTERWVELGFLLPLCFSAFALARVVGIV
jgi:hypothetical protein